MKSNPQIEAYKRGLLIWLEKMICKEILKKDSDYHKGRLLAFDDFIKHIKSK